MVSCENGHENPEGRLFCGDCGIPIVPTMAICALGHVNSKDQHFCGDCGVPIRAPENAVTGASGGRWNVDPSGAHQYRYWDGARWTANVADNGAFSEDDLQQAKKWHPETWVGVAAGVVTVLLVVGAIIGVVLQLSGSDRATATESSVAPTDTEVAPEPAASAPPEPADPAPPAAPGVPLVAVIGTPCRPNSSPSTTADGSTAYCEPLQTVGTHMWSLFPGEIPYPYPGGTGTGQNPSVGVCMAQTSRTEVDCIDYLRRSSDPGDGGEPAT